MPVRQRLVFLGLSLATLLVVARLTTGSYEFVTDQFWFTAGLLMLILLSVIDQPHFSRDANVFINGLAGLISLLAVEAASREFLWRFFLGWSAYLVSSSYVLMWLRSGELAEEPWLVGLVARVNREIGKPEALFSAFFLWGVYTQLGPESAAFRPLFIFWAVFILLNLPAVARAIGHLLTRRESKPVELAGRVTRFRSPRMFDCTLTHIGPALPLGMAVDVLARDGTVAASGVVTEDRVLDGTRYCRVSVSDFKESWPRLSAGDGPGSSRIRLVPSDDPPQTHPVGVVEPQSDILTLRLSVSPQAALEEGEVLKVRLGEREAYYQIVGARVSESTAAGQIIQEIGVSATQLGLWDPVQSRFEPVTWVAPPGELVLRVTAEAALAAAIPEGCLKVGEVPNSAFPVHVSVQDVVTHNTAILGVTGSGKSYLAFRIIEELARQGIKVLVLDISRQHWVFLNHLHPVAIRRVEDIAPWVGGTSQIAVHQFADAHSYPERTADLVQAALREMEARVTLRPGHNEPARTCIVIEEAHSLVPEWNQVAERDDPAHVNRAARALLQGRKYGMGCLLISQRTANVTKTILNQCNTIFALQSFDQTGLDFLKNYMGEGFAQVISTMPTRHAILVGKASSSRRPVMFRISDLAARWIPDDEQPEVDGANHAN